LCIKILNIGNPDLDMMADETQAWPPLQRALSTHTYEHTVVYRGCLWPHSRDLDSWPPLQSDPTSGGHRAGLPKLVLSGVIRPELPAGATQAVLAPSYDLEKAHRSPQLPPVLQAGCLLESVQIPLIKHINLELTICACFPECLGEKNARKKNLIWWEGLTLMDEVISRSWL
jgi:hypothetical protein